MSKPELRQGSPAYLDTARGPLKCIVNTIFRNPAGQVLASVRFTGREPNSPYRNREVFSFPVGQVFPRTALYQRNLTTWVGSYRVFLDDVVESVGLFNPNHARYFRFDDEGNRKRILEAT